MTEKMPLRDALQQNLKEAIRNRDQCASSTLRLILAAIKDRDIGLREKNRPEGLRDDEILLLLHTMIKQRQDSIKLYEQGGRLELADQERAEIVVIQKFLPRQFTKEEIEQLVDKHIEEIDAHTIKDMGRLMAKLKADYAGQMDFALASNFAKARLTA